MVLVSIVVPIYNVEKYLDECLSSIQKQTLTDLEVICVDDGSKDNSLEIVKKYMDSDSRFKCITKPNAGYGDSMNRGFDAANGEYIGIVESDDYVEPNMFEILYAYAKKYNCDVVKSDYYEFTTKNYQNQTYVQTPTDKKYYEVVLDRTLGPELFHFRMNTWTGIYRREFIKHHNIRHNETPGAAYQDNGFWFQTLSLANRIMFIDRAFYHYRQDNPNSSINSKGKVFCMCDEYAFIEDFLRKDKKLYDELVGVFLVKKFFNYMYTYKRIAEEHKLDFLNRFADDFRGPLADGLIADQFVGPYVKGMILRIVKNPEIFYYEDTIWQYQHKVMDSIIKIEKRDSNRFYALFKKIGVL